MYPLSCVDSFRYPGVDEVYVTDLIPLTQGPATTSSDQKLCVFNPLSLRPGPVSTLQTNHGNLTCAKAFDLGGSVVCTAGEDGSISMWDLRKDAREAEVARLTGANGSWPITVLPLTLTAPAPRKTIKCQYCHWLAPVQASPLPLAPS